jgi:hypothetical protein
MHYTYVCLTRLELVLLLAPCPLYVVQLKDRRAAMLLEEEASKKCSPAYRAPELTQVDNTARAHTEQHTHPHPHTMTHTEQHPQSSPASSLSAPSPPLYTILRSPVGGAGQAYRCSCGRVVDGLCALCLGLRTQPLRVPHRGTLTSPPPPYHLLASNNLSSFHPPARAGI